WYGSLSDSGEIPAPLIVDFAREWFLPQHIVIGHLNFMPVTTVFDELQEIIAERELTTVTLNDVFSSEYHP
ncbi:MAG: polysaccharide deacetylase family protein, partial [Actinomycetota bacterium]|nr:polysaccharide deacetylase family protein [Actinomycetota bacterium]